MVISQSDCEISSKCGKKINRNVVFRGTAPRESTTFWPLWWRVSLSIKLYTTLNHIRFVKFTFLWFVCQCGVSDWKYEFITIYLCRWLYDSRQWYGVSFPEWPQVAQAPLGAVNMILCNSVIIRMLYLPTQLRFLIGGEHVTCHWSKLNDALGRTKLTNSLGKQQLKLWTSTWSGCAPWSGGKFLCLSAWCQTANASLSH